MPNVRKNILKKMFGSIIRKVFLHEENVKKAHLEEARLENLASSFSFSFYGAETTPNTLSKDMDEKQITGQKAFWLRQSWTDGKARIIKFKLRNMRRVNEKQPTITIG